MALGLSPVWRTGFQASLGYEGVGTAGALPKERNVARVRVGLPFKPPEREYPSKHTATWPRHELHLGPFDET